MLNFIQQCNKNNFLCLFLFVCFLLFPPNTAANVVFLHVYYDNVNGTSLMDFIDL